MGAVSWEVLFAAGQTHPLHKEGVCSLLRDHGETSEPASGPPGPHQAARDDRSALKRKGVLSCYNMDEP